MLIKSLFMIFVSAMLPVGELRGAIPLGIIFYKLNPALVLMTGLLGNLVPVFIIYPIGSWIIGWAAQRKDVISNLITKVVIKTGRVVNLKHRPKGLLAVLILAAIPLPLVGGTWTATAAAYLLGFSIKKSFFYIASGAVLSGLMITLSVIGAVDLGRFMLTS